LVPYFFALGINQIYSSPLLQARSGSLHCYDVINHGRLNPEISSSKEFEEFVRELQKHGMSLLLDIVPNHMAADFRNEIWEDVLRLGKQSRFAGYFDIFWTDDKKNKVVLPVLGEKLESLVKSGKVKIAFNSTTLDFRLEVGGQLFPVSPAGFMFIIDSILNSLPDIDLQDEVAGQLRVLKSQIATRSFQATDSDEWLISGKSRESWMSLKVVETIQSFINSPNVDLEELLTLQNYKLEYWVDGLKDLNFRRFFNVTDLVAIRQEYRPAFEESHSLIMDLVSQKVVTGFRIDHIDGLWDPPAYLAKLSNVCKHELKSTRRFPVFVEKIITQPEENLRHSWPVEGTTGYDFLNDLNGIFVERRSASKIRNIYSRFTGDQNNFDKILFDSKVLIIERFMQPDVKRLEQLLRGFAKNSLKESASFKRAIELFAANFPVYRTYIDATHAVEEADLKLLRKALTGARKVAKTEGAGLEGFTAIEVVLRDATKNSRKTRESRKLLQSFQQLTSAVVAKGAEDTAFYRYFPLSSLNEVGGNPDLFGISVNEFHNRNLYRYSNWPHTLLASSTHDTKRSEDVRARINVLSEMPDEWGDVVSKWGRTNARYRRDKSSPSRLIEYLLYQTLLGCIDSFDFVSDQGELNPSFIKRIVRYVRKASNEAELETSWTFPNEEYDESLESFVQNILSKDNPSFLYNLVEFATKIRSLGRLNSISQIVLKLTCPGIPDIYQGNELWDYSLVDPDNRRPVDFDKRKEIISSLNMRLENEPLASLASSLLKNSENGEIKMFLIKKILDYRKENSDLFRSGNYIPLSINGSRKNNVVAFARNYNVKKIIVVTSRFFNELIQKDHTFPVGGEIWRDSFLRIPLLFNGKKNLRDILTGQLVQPVKKKGHFGLEMGQVLSLLPVAVLESK